MGNLRNPAADVRDQLNGQTAGGIALTSGTNLFGGPMRSGDRTPSPAVFIQATGGAQPDAYLQGRRTALYRPSVQVLVRGTAADFQLGESVARGVYELLHMKVVSPYISWMARDAQPVLVSLEDSAQHPVWAINLECVYKVSLD